MTKNEVKMRLGTSQSLALTPVQESWRTNPQVGGDALGRLMAANRDYLNEKLRVCDVPKPSPYEHKMPGSRHHSEYDRQYKLGLVHHANPKIKPAENGVKITNNGFAQYTTTYAAEYKSLANKLTPHSHLAKSPYVPSDAPAFLATSNQRDYSWNNIVMTESAKRAEIPLMGEGKFQGESTYMKNYRMKTLGSKIQPIIHKNNKLFLDIQKQDKSQYQDTFKSKQPTKPEKSCKPNGKYVKTPGKMKYATEYGQQFVPQKNQVFQDFSCLTHQQLKQFIMKAIQK